MQTSSDSCMYFMHAPAQHHMNATLLGSLAKEYSVIACRSCIRNHKYLTSPRRRIDILHCF